MPAYPNFINNIGRRAAPGQPSAGGMGRGMRPAMPQQRPAPASFPQSAIAPRAMAGPSQAETPPLQAGMPAGHGAGPAGGPMTLNPRAIGFDQEAAKQQLLQALQQRAMPQGIPA